jgi:hypothetical protein
MHNHSKVNVFPIKTVQKNLRKNETSFRIVRPCSAVCRQDVGEAKVNCGGTKIIVLFPPKPHRSLHLSTHRRPFAACCRGFVTVRNPGLECDPSSYFLALECAGWNLERGGRRVSLFLPSKKKKRQRK